MSSGRKLCEQVSVISFLDNYPEPTFILCANTTPHTSIDFIYGNPALHTALFGHDAGPVLDNQSFFGALKCVDDLRWFSNPVTGSSRVLGPMECTRTILLHPTWLPRDHECISLDLTATEISLPADISEFKTTSHFYVFIASPRKTPVRLLHPEANNERKPSQMRSSIDISVFELLDQGPSRQDTSEPAPKVSPLPATSELAGMPSRMIETYSWEKTSLGPRESWPTVLKLVVQQLMTNPIPSIIYWSWPDQIAIYNDPYARMIGNKHPHSFGGRAKDGWPELWDRLSPISEQVQRGRLIRKDDDPLFFNSRVELNLPEAYHTWYRAPIWQADGTVGGVWSSMWETTQKVIAERRLGAMSELAPRLSDARTREQFLQGTMNILSRNPLDLPFVALYWCNVDGATLSTKNLLPSTYVTNRASDWISVKLTLADSLGIPDGHPMNQQEIKYILDLDTYSPVRNPLDSGSLDFDNQSERPPMNSSLGSSTSTLRLATSTSSNGSIGIDLTGVFASGAMEIIEPLSVDFAQGLNTRGFKDIPRAVAVIPISIDVSLDRGSANIRRLPHAVVVLGLNTRRAYDTDYAIWLKGLGAILSSHLRVVLQREVGKELVHEQEKMDKAKTLFFTNISHGKTSHTTDIDSGAIGTTRNHSGKTTRLAKLVDSIMDMSKLEAGKLNGNFRPVQLSQITADLASLFQALAEKKGIDYHISCAEEEEEPPVYLDIDLWEKIICNLYDPHPLSTAFHSTTRLTLDPINSLSNAFKYTSEGSVSIEVTHDTSKSHVRVSDTGKGIPRDYIDNIFERFFRINHSTAEGTGIGLSLTKELIKFHGGQMDLVSHTRDDLPGQSGSTFTVSIPHGSGHLPAAFVREDLPHTRSFRNKREEYWIELEESISSVTSDSGESESVAGSSFSFEADDVLLVVDSSPDMRSYIRKIFNPHLTVLEARDGVEALQIALSQEIGLILSDVMMPRMGGPELLQRLRQSRRTRFLPVIFLTSSDDDALFGGEVDGIVDRISKPFRVRDLLTRVHLQLQIGKQRAKLEDDLVVRTHELQVLTDMSPVGIFKADTEGKLAYTNSTWHHITGLALDQDQDAWIDNVHASSKGDILRMWRECFEAKVQSSMKIQWTNGRWTHLAVSPLLSPELAILGVFGAVTDISEQHRAEEARITLAEEREQAAALKARESETQRLLEVDRRRAQELLIDVTSHELRQPVSAIIQNMQVVRANMQNLLNELDDCRARSVVYSPRDLMVSELIQDLQSMDNIEQCGMALARIANDVLSLSRLQLDVLSIIPTDFNIKEVTNQIIMVFQTELLSKNIQLQVDLGHVAEAHGLHTISADHGRYAQIITNLISNAIHFTDMSSGVREILVKLELSPDPPQDGSCALPPLRGAANPFFDRSPKSNCDNIPVYVYVSVHDSGPGLLKEDLDLLFQRFQQGSNAHHVFGGAGLGLFVCRQLCDLMGGRMEVINDQGGGANFRFFIKASLSENQTITSPTPQKSDTSVTLKGSNKFLPEASSLRQDRPLHVLITEDNKINQTVLARQMKKQGFTVTLANNGLEAVRAIEKLASEFEGASDPRLKFDVILMDLEMPVLDGFAAAREIREREANGDFKARNFIIALTGNARPGQVQSARASGVDDVMLKVRQ
ncbi:unnamed protein product [Rhizoctonia solani]|uniref:Uncharacterized protein n=1 Tax=Rhizoctonia solani TaxID=456999 RepID=A0A8H3BY72_9AGAM|nr:unnamed protein product [Rhizoctonia solani]